MNFRTSGSAFVWGLLVAAAVLSAIACASHAQPSPGRQLQELSGRPISGLVVPTGPVGLQKRPFCNAFTGCAGKRAPFALPSSDRQRIRFFRKFNTIDNSDSDEYVADNTNYDREMIQE